VVDVYPTLAEDLTALGYASSGTRDVVLPPLLADTGLPSSANTADELQLIVRATELTGDREAAEALHRRILEKNPNNYHSLETVALYLMADRKFKLAADQLERVLTSDRGSPSAATNLGICKRLMGRRDEAIHWLERALEMDANHVGALLHLWDLHTKKAEAQQAAGYAARYEALTGERPKPLQGGRR